MQSSPSPQAPWQRVKKCDSPPVTGLPVTDPPQAPANSTPSPKVIHLARIVPHSICIGRQLAPEDALADISHDLFVSGGYPKTGVRRLHALTQGAEPRPQGTELRLHFAFEGVALPDVEGVGAAADHPARRGALRGLAQPLADGLHHGL